MKLTVKDIKHIINESINNILLEANLITEEEENDGYNKDGEFTGVTHLRFLFSLWLEAEGYDDDDEFESLIEDMPSDKNYSHPWVNSEKVMKFLEKEYYYGNDKAKVCLILYREYLREKYKAYRDRIKAW